MKPNKIVRILGVSMDLGQALRGVDMGPSAVRYAGLTPLLRAIGLETEDYGNVDVPVRDSFSATSGAGMLPAVVAVCEETYRLAQRAIEENRLPIFLGGDHSISIGTIGGVSHSGPVGVLWVDAHGDFNDFSTSPSGNIHGMPLATVCGIGDKRLVDLGRPGRKVDPQHVALIGVRDLDPGERALMQQSGVRVFTMRSIDELGVFEVTRQALEAIGDVAHIHVSLDMDALDPDEAPGVGTKVPGGLTYREAHLLLEIVADSGRVGSVDVVEINPILDTTNQTADKAVALVQSVLGKSIY